MKSIKTLFILFSLFSMNFSLLAKDALPVLVEGGESFDNRDDFYISNQRSINAIAISTDGKTIVSGSSDNSIKIWNRTTGELEQTLEGHKNRVYFVAISNDGKTIVSGSNDKTIKVWNRATGRLEKTLKGDEYSVESIAISSDGKIISSSSTSGIMKIWDRVTGELKQTLEGHKNNVWSIAISEDGKNIISGSLDGSIYLWDIKRGKKLKEFISGQNDTWVTFDYETKKFFRGDDGTLVYKEENKEKKPFLPKWLPKEDKLIIEIKNKYGLSLLLSEINKKHKKSKIVKLINLVNLATLSSKLEIINEKSIIINISIFNNSKNKLYWLKGEYKDKYCFIPKNRVSNINSMEEQNLSLKIYAKLPSLNPKPIEDHEINLTLKTSSNTEYNLNIPINIKYANIIVNKAEISDDKKSIYVEFKNIGNEKLKKAKVKLIQPFKYDLQEITELNPSETKILSFVTPKDFKLDKNTTLDLSVFVSGEKNISNREPTYIWKIKNIKISENKLKVYTYLYMILSIVLFLGIKYIKLYKNSLVLKLENPKELLTLNMEQLKEAKERLTKIDRFENILIQNTITQQRYTQATVFTTMTPKQKAKHLSQRIFAQSKPLGTDSYMMTLKDDFPLNVKSFILFFSNKESLDDMMSDIKEIPQYRSHILFVVGDSSEKQLGFYEQGVKHEKIVLPHPKEMTRLLLESDGSKVLADIFALQLALTQISPYQLGGGVKSSMFFGRAEIVSHILGRDNSNYIVIGSRQIGKSSLLKAIEREYKKSHEEVYYISLNAGNLVKGMAKALRLRAKTLDEVVSYLLQEPKPYLFLIDEADKFVQYEKAQGYETLNALRKLSEESRANFIVAGFWELYQHAILDYQSPLKNFGETIELGALEREACEEMMREPMKQLGLSIKEEAIESVIDQVGQRANLIAIVCHNIIKNLGKTKKEITLKDAQEAMKEKNVFELFESWRELNDDERANRLDRIIVYATVKEGKFTLKSLLDSLKERGFRVDIAEIEKSLDRLKVSYTIEQNSKGEYLYRVALFREYILRGEYAVKLEGEIEVYRAS